MRNRPITIAVDAMGGDYAPQREVEGAVLATRQSGVRILLVGQEEVLRQELRRHSAENLPLEVVHASQVITMEESAARSVRQKRNSSIRVATSLVQQGRAQGLVSAGNTGAVMATAKIVWGTLPSVDRPALAAVIPPLRGQPAILIDVGANVDCKPEQLQQFAIMGEVYARLLLHISQPRVGLLSIGSEQIKGNELTREAYRLLEQSPLDFIGNVEGRELYQGRVDVIVCDGFTGNVALKISEGLAEAIQELLKETLSATPSAKAASLLVGQALADFAKRMDYSESGGAVLLGVKGVCMICHGSSSPQAIQNAIRKAAEYASAGINEKIEQELQRLDPGSRAARRQTAASH